MLLVGWEAESVLDDGEVDGRLVSVLGEVVERLVGRRFRNGLQRTDIQVSERYRL